MHTYRTPPSSALDTNRTNPGKTDPAERTIQADEILTVKETAAFANQLESERFEGRDYLAVNLLLWRRRMANVLLSPYMAHGPGGTSRNSTNFQSHGSLTPRPR